MPDVETRVLAIASGKGGVGKSTVALNLGVALHRAGARVGLLDADLYGPDIPRMVGLTRHRPATSIDLWTRSGPSGVPIVERHGLKITSAQFLVAEDQPISFQAGLAGLLLRRLLGADWGQLDYLIVDLPPGTADIQQQLSENVTIAGVLVVVTPQDVAHLDARKLLAMLDQRGLRVIGGVENMSSIACPRCGERTEVFPPTDETRAVWTRITKLASLPIDPSLALAADEGTIADGAMTPLFDDLAARVARELG